MDIDGRELYHFKATFFRVIGNARHLMGSEAPANAILDLKASICSWIRTPVIRLYVSRRLEPSWKLHTHDVIREGHLIIVHIFLTRIMPRLLAILYPRRMRISVLNVMRIFATRFPGMHISPRSIMASGTPPLIVTLISVLILFISASNSMTVFLPILFANSSHFFYVVLQFPNMLSLLLHH